MSDPEKPVKDERAHVAIIQNKVDFAVEGAEVLRDSFIRCLWNLCSYRYITLDLWWMAMVKCIQAMPLDIVELDDLLWLKDIEKFSCKKMQRIVEVSTYKRYTKHNLSFESLKEFINILKTERFNAEKVRELWVVQQEGITERAFGGPFRTDKTEMLYSSTERTKIFLSLREGVQDELSKLCEQVQIYNPRGVPYPKTNIAEHVVHMMHPGYIVRTFQWEMGRLDAIAQTLQSQYPKFCRICTDDQRPTSPQNKLRWEGSIKGPASKPASPPGSQPGRYQSPPRDQLHRYPSPPRDQLHRYQSPPRGKPRRDQDPGPAWAEGGGKTQVYLHTDFLLCSASDGRD